MPLTEYASAYGPDVKDLYAGKAQLVKKGLLPSRTPAPAAVEYRARSLEDSVQFAKLSTGLESIGSVIDPTP